jgi:ribonuclease D
VRNVFDTRVAAQLLGIKAFGLAALLEQFFGMKLDKKHQRADWSMRPLTKDMLDYAAQDTMYLPALRDELKGLLEKKGRWSWAREEFTRLEATKWATEDEGLAFMKMKGARDLSRRELALLKELVEWRNSVAGEYDKATFRILGNEPLFEIAKTAPRERAALSAIKGMPRGILETRSHEMLDAVARGLAVPEADLPKFPRGPRWDRDPDFDAKVSAIKTVRDQIAADLDMDTGVLFSREKMESVARANPKSLEDFATIPDLRKWQVEVLGPGILKGLANHHGAEKSPYADG